MAVFPGTCLPLALNCSSVLSHLPLLRQPSAAAAAGFEEIELWWPYPDPYPSRRDMDRLVAAVEDAGVRVGLLNLFGGDLWAGERGFACIPGREQDFMASLDSALELGGRLGVKVFNPMYGLRVPGATADDQERTAVANLAQAAQRAGDLGATLTLEPLSALPAYPLATAASALSIIERVRDQGAANIGLLADFYHLSFGGEDMTAVIRRRAPDFARIQIADAPGRGCPGSGSLPLEEWVQAAFEAGYAGGVGLEYRTDEPDTCFSWLTDSPERNRAHCPEAGAAVELCRGGFLVRRGIVETVMPDRSGFWLAAEGVEPRAFVHLDYQDVEIGAAPAMSTETGEGRGSSPLATGRALSSSAASALGRAKPRFLKDSIKS
ncbi:hydroxypyruvate isomerase family protein [Sinomonas terrae]|uniref:TIM barrel protein n=1 Tax=Sinomonas terrae TaxID=2908838 RepID=A0ABS9U7Z0_9MICC|nr:TIM barrel protein [Sinomonas terrae]MCH6472390.1 TIM barrel protein [Sinomonas terrae]